MPACQAHTHTHPQVILLITGTLHERDTHELLERCHPLVRTSLPMDLLC